MKFECTNTAVNPKPNEPPVGPYYQVLVSEENLKPHTVTYVHTECPGCKEKDAEIERLTKIGFQSVLANLNHELQEKVEHLKTKFAKQYAEIERLRSQRNDWEETAGEMSDRSSRQFGEIEDLKSQLAKHESVEAYNAKIGEINAEIDAGRGENSKKLDAILALLEQWEPAKK